jgi:D-sedoheptulose 7-phosphate isomerase
MRVGITEQQGRMTFSRDFLNETVDILAAIPDDDVEAVVQVIRSTRDRDGRLFFCGSGGGAGHASHASCDFRKLAGIESYSVTDNVSELTARINDDGWETSYADWLVASRLSDQDCVFVFSVGGGDETHQISSNLISVMHLAKRVGASLVGVVGRNGGVLRQTADASIVIPELNPKHVTPQTEGLQALLWHLIVSHPALDHAVAKWESVSS